MAGLVPAIHAFAAAKEDVDARGKRGHDGKTFYPSSAGSQVAIAGNAMINASRMRLSAI